LIAGELKNDKIESFLFLGKNAKAGSSKNILNELSEGVAIHNYDTPETINIGGPGQPEMSSFQSVNSNNMVDLFTGDFSYNIPLLDVGGYPINLVYHSGASMDEESGWVGYGWTLSPGVLNRQMRGIPDDFNGADTMTRYAHMKDHI